MDLTAAGAFNDARLWQMLEKRGAALYREIHTHPTPFRPEVAVIVDPRALYHVRSDWDLPANALTALLDASGTTGVHTGYYCLSDFLEGLVPTGKGPQPAGRIPSAATERDQPWLRPLDA
jgi:hypothetical protein